MKITFIGAGSTTFARNVIGDCILTPELGDFDVCLFDIDPSASTIPIKSYAT